MHIAVSMTKSLTTHSLLRCTIIKNVLLIQILELKVLHEVPQFPEVVVQDMYCLNSYSFVFFPAASKQVSSALRSAAMLARTKGNTQCTEGRTYLLTTFS